MRLVLILALLLISGLATAQRLPKCIAEDSSSYILMSKGNLIRELKAGNVPAFRGRADYTWNSVTSGTMLADAGKEFRTGLLVGVVGSAAGIAVTYVVPQNRELSVIAFGLTSVLSVGFFLESSRKMSLSGKLLELEKKRQ